MSLVGEFHRIIIPNCRPSYVPDVELLRIFKSVCSDNEMCPKEKGRILSEISQIVSSDGFATRMQKVDPEIRNQLANEF